MSCPNNDAKLPKARYSFDMIIRITMLTIGLSLSSVAVTADSLYRSSITYIPDAERSNLITVLQSIETPSERQYLTQIGLEKPDVLARQLGRAREILLTGGQPSEVAAKLRTAGFYSPETQSAIQAFVLNLHPDDVVNVSHVMDFAMRLNNPTGFWDYMLDDAVTMDDYAALECASGQVPTKLLGPPEHQYVMQVAHPNMELSLWRFDATEAVTYPVATVANTTVDFYQLIDRFGNEMARLDRSNLSMQSPSGEVLNCQKIDPSVMRAYQTHRREMVLSEKQL